MSNSESTERNTSTKPQLSETDKTRLEEVAISRRIKLEQLQKMRSDIKRRIKSKNEDEANSDEPNK